jgi:hypothetical protein
MPAPTPQTVRAAYGCGAFGTLVDAALRCATTHRSVWQAYAASRSAITVLGCVRGARERRAARRNGWCNQQRASTVPPTTARWGASMLKRLVQSATCLDGSPQPHRRPSDAVPNASAPVRAGVPSSQAAVEVQATSRAAKGRDDPGFTSCERPARGPDLDGRSLWGAPAWFGAQRHGVDAAWREVQMPTAPCRCRLEQGWTAARWPEGRVGAGPDPSEGASRYLP